MAKEIEWRFLVTKLPALPPGGEGIVQAYLNANSPAVRVRLQRGRATVAIKAPASAANEGPLQRHEFEYEIPYADGEQLVALCDNRIEKVRYEMDGGIELDVFEGRLGGLIIAEVEVAEVCGAPSPPPGWEWIDITRESRYSNQALAFEGLPANSPRCVRG